MADYSSANGSESILQEVLNLVKKHQIFCQQNDDLSQKVIEFVHPEELVGRLGDLTIGSSALSDLNVSNLLESVIRYSVKTSNQRFYNQLYHGVDVYGLAGSWLSDALNTNNYTYEVAPVFIVVEKALMRYCMQMFGWNPEDGDGITAPGGSVSNFYGMVLARYRLMPESKTKGLFGAKPMVVFTSEESHYSIVKGANWLGLGTDNVVKVKTDCSGRMIPEDLEKVIRKSIKEGKIPMMVNATSGTTVCGAFDDLAAIYEVCSKFNPQIWLHVDACWGGSAIMSKNQRHLMTGSEKADSLSWNAHKMLGAPLQASIFICRHKNLLHRTNSAAATYLFQQDKFYDVNYDTGDMSVQCGRKVDAFKIWFMLKSRGKDFFEDLVDNAFEQARYLADQIRSRPGFELVFDPVSCTNVCFTYKPPCLRDCKNQVKLAERMVFVPPMIKEAMIKKGSLMVGYQPLKRFENFFRMVVHCLPKSSNKDMTFVLDEIDRIGKEIRF